MEKEKLKDYLDHQFMELFKDKTQERFKVGDSIVIHLTRKKSLRQSKIEVYRGYKLWFVERLGRFENYSYFLRVMVSILESKAK